MTKSLRLAAYIRVSRTQGREGVAFMAPEQQRAAIQAYCVAHGHELEREAEDLDVSGSRTQRPGLDSLLESVRAGEIDGIIVARMDRLSRLGIVDAMGLVQRISEDGGAVVAVDLGMDPTTPTGEMMWTFLLALARYQWRTLAESWQDAKARAISRGAHIARAPVGYVRGEDGRLLVDPDAAPSVREAFSVAARQGLPATVALLSERLPQRTWTSFTVRRLLSTRTYLGRVDYGELSRDGAHEAIVTRGVFEAANHAVGEGGGVRGVAGEYPLSGIASCGTCGAALIGARGGNDARRMYRCSRHRDCAAAVATSAGPLEDHVVAVLRAAFQHPGFSVGEPDADVDERVAGVEEAERELEAFASDLTARRLLGEDYHRHLQVRVDAVGEARAGLAQALEGAREATVVVPDELWDDLTPRELRVVLGAMLDTVVVDRGRGPLAGRVRVIPHGLDVGAVTLPQDP